MCRIEGGRRVHGDFFRISPSDVGLLLEKLVGVGFFRGHRIARWLGQVTCATFVVGREISLVCFIRQALKALGSPNTCFIFAALLRQ